MTKAALYARVSTDAQQKEGTIESQLAELRKQIAAAGHELVEEYIDDGHTGTLLDRPALNRMRADVKTDRFDRIYFLAADRIARDVEYQRIIVGELLKHGKQITINGKDYVQNPENKLTLTMLGAFSEFERAKIIERTTRGRLHRLRMGEMSSNGHRIFGYHYVKKTSTAPATLAINEEQAAVVRSIFEMFASGEFGLVTISRHLEEHRILTSTGRQRWDNDRIKSILMNETYTGTRYFNRIVHATDANREGKKVIRGQWIFRDRSEWIAVKVPAIVSRELFDKVQDKLREHDARYCQPVTHYLLSGLVQCGVCGNGCSSFRRWQKVVRPSGGVSVYHHAAYRCNRRARENNHDRTQIDRCTNSEISTHILEGHVFEMVREAMLDPGKLRGCVDSGAGIDDRTTARELTKVAQKIGALDHARRELISRYAADQMTGDEYIAANRALDEKLERLVRAKAKLAGALRPTHHEDFVDASILQFCATARARLQACSDFDTKRQFLVDYIERVTYNRYHVTIVGSIPVRTESRESKLPFRIEGKINIAGIRSNSCRKAALAAMQSTGAVSDTPTAEDQPVSLPLIRYAEVTA
jgi:DNA invertase Pin-like site-specific DNA recombinase